MALIVFTPRFDDRLTIILYSGFAWQSALKTAAPIKLQLLTNARLHDAFESAVRGGVASVMKRFAVANQPDLPNYDPSLPRQDMIYLDAVNLVSILYAYILNVLFTFLRQYQNMVL